MVLIFLIILFLLTSCATSRPWTKGEKVAAGFFCVAHFADYYTTEKALDNPNNYENNPILDKHPSDGKLTVYFSLTGAVALILGHFWPELRKPLFLSYGTVNSALAIHNYKLNKRTSH